MIFFAAVFVMIVALDSFCGRSPWRISKNILSRRDFRHHHGIIGVTFMVIYRSTMAQANQFMEVLERINTVGMAVQILDTIPNEALI